MTTPHAAHAAAERILRRFARDTNLLIAGRPFRVSAESEDAATAIAVAGMAHALGALLVGEEEEPDEPGARAHRDQVVDIEIAGEAVTLSLGGVPLASRGDAAGRLDFAHAHMPVSRALAHDVGEAGTVAGLRIGIAMTLEPKTATLALLLRDAGADVAVYAHPDETDAEVAAVLRERGIAVDADPTLSGDAERAAALAWLRRGFDVVVDDGSHLVRLAHESAPAEVARWIGVTEETTSGLTPLRLMASQGVLATPVVAVNDAPTKTSFDNRYGTGQSCMFAIADLLEQVDLSVRDQVALVVGYGPVGQGVAAHLAALGAVVEVAEADPVRALLATHDGYRVVDPALGAADALVVSCTGVPGTVTAAMVAAARVVAVAGGVTGEVDVPGDAVCDAIPGVRAIEVVDTPGSPVTLLLDRGGCINVTAAEGNPIEIMDLSFATQVAAIAHLVTARPPVGVHALPESAVRRVALHAAATRGLPLASLEAQALSPDWRSPRYRGAR